MSFWSRIFKRNTEVNSVTIVQSDLVEETVQEEVVLCETVQKEMVTEVQNVIEEYEIAFSLSTKEEQERIVEFIRPITDRWQVINLKLSYGVRVNNTGLFMVSYRTISERDKDRDKTFYKRCFVVLYKGECFEAFYTSDNMHDEGELVFDVPKEFEEPLMQAMDYYRNWQEHKVFKENCKEQEPFIDVQHINNTLLAPLFDEYEMYEAEQKKQRMAQRKFFEVNSEEAAKKLFFLCQPYHKLQEDYTEETVTAFERFATREKKKEWVIEECKQILSDIIDGDRENLFDKFEKINGRCGYFLGSESDALALDYTKACKVLFDSGEERFAVCIHSYLSYLKNSKNPEVAKELLDITEKYYQKKYSEEYERGSVDKHPQKFKHICCQLRGKMRELAPVNNAEGFKFVLTTQETLRQIVLSYRKRYNDDDAVKECVAELNCAYGVENDKLFLTARCNSADSYLGYNWDRFWFVAVLKETEEIIEFRCRREEKNGGFVADYYDGPLEEYWPLVESALEYYRNVQERNKFFEQYSQEHNGEQIGDLKQSAHKGLLSRFKRHYEKEYKRVNDNLLKNILIKLVDLCEETGPTYGYKNTVIGKPATDDEIVAWEQKNNITLPDNYKNFLRFADGIRLLGSEHISGLQQLNPNDKYLEDGYIHIGEMIGDGTVICMSKTNGRIYIADHGEYEDKGDFRSFLEYFVDFLCGLV